MASVLFTDPLRLSRRLVHALKRRAWKIEPLSINPYATHVPVLVACACLFKPARILELGSGHYSTPLFLDREIFPEVVFVRSLENDPVWFKTLDYLRDTRLERILVNGSIYDSIKDLDCSGFDLIFVDDSPSAGERRRTLDVLRRKVLGAQLVVVHDFDLWPIRLAVHSYARHCGMLALTPQCAVAWNDETMYQAALKKADDIVRAFRARIGGEDARGWRDRFVKSMAGDG
jgi:hypothetical protein